MVRITIDEETRQKLLSSGEAVELVDESGRTLGRFVPLGEVAGGSEQVLTPELSDEEYRRRMESDGPVMTTDELLAHLRGKA